MFALVEMRVFLNFIILERGSVMSDSEKNLKIG